MIKRFLLIIIVLILVMIFVIGCGGSKKTEPITNDQQQAVTNPTTQVEPPALPSKPEVDSKESWMNAKNLIELVKLVDKMSWRVDGDVFHYTYLGREVVKGVQGEVVSIVVEDEKIKFWIDDNGKILQALVDDEYLPSEYLDHVSIYMLAPLMPFQLSGEEQLQRALTGKDVPGWKVLKSDKGKTTISRKTIDVQTIVIQAKDPFSVGAGEYTISFSFGNFDSKRLIIGWSILEGAGRDEEFVEFAIESLTFR
jgi:hypothetical protein